MTELRRDPITGTWSIFAAERAKRVKDFTTAKPAAEDPARCPFCPGHEHETPSELAAVRPTGAAPNTPDWTVRIVPNKYPALSPRPIQADEAQRTHGLYDRLPAAGAHDVVILTPLHTQTLHQCSVDHIDGVLALSQHRMREILEQPHIRYPLLFQNHGPAAGASRAHPHLQILGMPLDPETVLHKAHHARVHHEETDRCLFCRVMQQEEKHGERLVEADSDYVTHAPFASRLPYEMMLMPRVHRHSFLELPQGERRRLASHFKRVLQRLHVAVSDPPYNWILVTSPHDGHPDSFHWHIEILPRLTAQAGVEWGAGAFVNPVHPEQAAADLRAVTL